MGLPVWAAVFGPPYLGPILGVVNLVSLAKPNNHDTRAQQQQQQQQSTTATEAFASLARSQPIQSLAALGYLGFTLAYDPMARAFRPRILAHLPLKARPFAQAIGTTYIPLASRGTSPLVPLSHLSRVFAAASWTSELLDFWTPPPADRLQRIYTGILAVCIAMAVSDPSAQQVAAAIAAGAVDNPFLSGLAIGATSLTIMTKTAMHTDHKTHMGYFDTLAKISTAHGPHVQDGLERLDRRALAYRGACRPRFVHAGLVGGMVVGAASLVGLAAESWAKNARERKERTEMK